MPDPARFLADRFVAKFDNVVYLHDTFWRFDNGRWAELPLDVLQGELAILIERDGKPSANTAKLLRAAPDILRARLYCPDYIWNTDPNLLPCSNGLLNLRDRQIVDHTAAYHLARTCGAMYDWRPEVATCPAWDAFMASTFPPAEARFLQEFAGLSLTFDNRYETAVWLFGPPGSGKSTFVHGLELILGERAGVLNLANLARGEISAASLFGRSLLISVEQPVADLKHDHLINALVSGEPIPIGRYRKGELPSTARA